MKYELLKSFLASQKQERLRLSFAEIARIARTRLPASAYEHPAWWANDARSHVQARAWLETGYKTENLDLAAQRVEFVRVTDPARGVREMEQKFDHESRSTVKKHPMAGALKGTFTIAPGWDLTRPAFDEDELAEWDANLDRQADRIEKGLRDKR